MSRDLTLAPWFATEHDSAVASLAHVIVGCGGGRALRPRERLPWRPMLALSALSMLPDLDVVGFKFGVPYAAPFGHRGATHSLLFAIVAAFIATFLARREGERSSRLLFIALVVAVSHPLLDALTDGGLGVSLLWPISTHRFFFPWTPIPVAPIGARMLTARGLRVLLYEAAWSLPLAAWALWPRGDPPSAKPPRVTKHRNH